MSKSNKKMERVPSETLSPSSSSSTSPSSASNAKTPTNSTSLSSSSPIGVIRPNIHRPKSIPKRVNTRSSKSAVSPSPSTSVQSSKSSSNPNSAAEQNNVRTKSQTNSNSVSPALSSLKLPSSSPQVNTSSPYSSSPASSFSSSSPSPNNPNSNPHTTTTVLISDNSTLEVDPYDALTAALVPGALHKNEYKVARMRYYILFVFCYLSALQGIVWCTFSTVPQVSNPYFNQDPGSQFVLDLFLNWGPIVYIPTVFLAARLHMNNQGLRLNFLLASLFVAASTIVRMIPTFLSSSYRDSNATYIIWGINAAQILNAFAAPLILASPSKLSVTWFADGERSFATALATISNGFGIGLAYLIIPSITTFKGTAADNYKGGLDYVLQLTCVMAGLPLLLCILYYPDHPKYFPSSTAAHRKNHSSASNYIHPLSFSSGLWHTLKNRSFFALVVSAGVSTGVYAAWSAVLPTLLQDQTPFTKEELSSLTGTTRFAGIVGGLVAGYLADIPALSRRLKPLLCVFLFFAIIAFTGFTLSSPSLDISEALLPADYFFSILAIGFAGFFLGATLPLSYELGAELTHPAPESTSAAFITLLIQVSTFIMLIVLPQIEETSMNSVMTITVSIALLLTFSISERYFRMDAGTQYAQKNEGVAAVLQYYEALDESFSPSSSSFKAEGESSPSSDLSRNENGIGRSRSEVKEEGME